MTDARERLIVALDLPDRATALAAVERLSGHVGYFKLGLELFIREGSRLVEEVRRREEKVFLDLKLHDIPNTVAGAVRSACALDVQMLTLHAAGGREMLEAAGDAAQAFPAPPLLLAVTALTSLSAESVRAVGIGTPLTEWVEVLAGVARQAGIPGLVASPLELSALRRKFGDELRIVVPGIRPTGSDTQDQSRTASPAQAILSGADYLVVGRPILRAADPALAADLIAREIGDSLSKRLATER